MEASIIAQNKLLADKTFLYSLRHLTIALEKIREQEIERYVKKLSSAEKELAESFTTEYIRKIISITVMPIRAMSEKSDVKGIQMTLALFNSESRFLEKQSFK